MVNLRFGKSLVAMAINGGSKNCLALNCLPCLFTVNLIKNIDLPKPISAKLFLLRVGVRYLSLLSMSYFINLQSIRFTGLLGF